jgi:hypothetical protein
MDVSQLIEIEAIKQLKARYFRLLDTQQWDDWGQVFSEDAILQWGPDESQIMNGRPAIQQGVSSSLVGAVTVHHGHMPEIELDGDDRATGIWSMYDRVDHPEFMLEGYGHYHEEYVKANGRWRIHRLKLTRLHEDRRPK